MRYLFACAIGEQAAQALFVGLADARFGDEAGDETRRRHVEAGIGRAASRRRDLDRGDFAVGQAARHRRDFALAAFLDRDHVARGERPVDRGRRQRDIERNVVVLGRERLQIGADLVGDVAVARSRDPCRRWRDRPCPAASDGRRHCRRRRRDRRRAIRARTRSAKRPDCADGFRPPRHAAECRGHAPYRSARARCPNRRRRASRHCNG